MSGHKYISSSKLFDDDDVDDETFVNSYHARNPPRQPTVSASPYGGAVSDLERQRQAMLQRQREIEQRTLDSSSRSIGILRESETIGIATAEELVRQREQLQNTNKRLDEINTNLNYSQKHLNGIKSVFYGFKNYISGKSDPTPPRSQQSPDPRSKPGTSSSRLEETMYSTPQQNSENRYETHASTRLRGLDEPSSASRSVTDSQRASDILDANLDEMVHAITRLKGLGAALGEEIDDQNRLLDTIQDKVEVADIKIGKQNKDMNKLLGK